VKITKRASASDEDGFGLVEIIISLFILAMIALALLPLLVQGIKTSAKTATVATAVQLVQDQLTQARSVSATCSAVASLAATTITATTDSRGVPLQVSHSAGTCPTSFPGTISFTASVTRTDTNAVVSTASTYIYVGS
jgi:type II secretory pathway pseudopilin PulG